MLWACNDDEAPAPVTFNKKVEFILQTDIDYNHSSYAELEISVYLAVSRNLYNGGGEIVWDTLISELAAHEFELINGYEKEVLIKDVEVDNQSISYSRNILYNNNGSETFSAKTSYLGRMDLEHVEIVHF
ncbi:hypothetical protein C900_03354 [Fulvivirga imtechensis AK7]|uniref:Uncharacterized protein n=1 Tax=Fulvivirga imtechensis AK7 TaxID=1237149 RepID=L8JP92_9BACT|nr:hypothetical protein C900_03354 [Fulvivirga imtechensis AK7]